MKPSDMTNEEPANAIDNHEEIAPKWWRGAISRIGLVALLPFITANQENEYTKRTETDHKSEVEEEEKRKGDAE